MDILQAVAVQELVLKKNFSIFPVNIKVSVGKSFSCTRKKRRNREEFIICEHLNRPFAKIYLNGTFKDCQTEFDHMVSFLSLIPDKFGEGADH